MADLENSFSNKNQNIQLFTEQKKKVKDFHKRNNSTFEGNHNIKIDGQGLISLNKVAGNNK